MREMVDRERERRQLLDAAGTVPALIVVIGRRRVGKSFLLERTFAGERVISFQGDEQDEAHQLELFAAETGRVLLGSDALRFDTWDSALTFLGDQARSGPLTVILDEFQWLKHAQRDSGSISGRKSHTILQCRTRETVPRWARHLRLDPDPAHLEKLYSDERLRVPETVRNAIRGDDEPVWPS